MEEENKTNETKEAIEQEEDGRDYRPYFLGLAVIVVLILLYTVYFTVTNFNLMKEDPLLYLQQKTGKTCQVVCTDENGLINQIYSMNRTYDTTKLYYLNTSKIKNIT